MALKLRKILSDDLHMIMKWRMMPQVTKYMYTDPLITMESQKLWYSNLQYDDSAKYWIIEMDNKPIGVLNLCFIDKKNSKCSWAYYIADTTFRGRGIGTLLECNIYDYVFYILELNKLWCEVFEFNSNVIKLHEKFGSEIEGVLKQHIIKNNEKYNVVVMGILREKWDKIKSNYVYDNIEIE